MLSIFLFGGGGGAHTYLHTHMYVRTNITHITPACASACWLINREVDFHATVQFVTIYDQTRILSMIARGLDELNERATIYFKCAPEDQDRANIDQAFRSQQAIKNNSCSYILGNHLNITEDLSLN